MDKRSYFCLVLACFCALTYPRFTSCKPDGAPAEACDTMTPEHDDTEPQEGPSPYKITLSAEEIEKDNGVVVTIESGENDTVKGFLVEMRDENGIPVGTFQPSEYVQAINCSKRIWNAATHTNNDDKKVVSIPWKAPSNGGQIKVLVTTVKDKSTYWVKEAFDLTISGAPSISAVSSVLTILVMVVANSLL